MAFGSRTWPQKKTPHLFATGDVLEKVVGLMERNLYGIQGARNWLPQKKRDLKIQMGQVWSAFTMLLGLLNFTSLICQVKSDLDGRLVSICIYRLWSNSWHIVVVVTSRRYLGSERWFVSTERCPRSIAGGLPVNTDWQHQLHYKEHLQVSDSRWNHNNPLAVSQCFTSSLKFDYPKRKLYHSKHPIFQAQTWLLVSGSL